MRISPPHRSSLFHSVCSTRYARIHLVSSHRDSSVPGRGLLRRRWLAFASSHPLTIATSPSENRSCTTRSLAERTTIRTYAVTKTLRATSAHRTTRARRSPSRTSSACTSRPTRESNSTRSSKCPPAPPLTYCDHCADMVTPQRQRARVQEPRRGQRQPRRPRRHLRGKDQGLLPVSLPRALSTAACLLTAASAREQRAPARG